MFKRNSICIVSIAIQVKIGIIRTTEVDAVVELLFGIAFMACNKTGVAASRRGIRFDTV